jgi:hypothetical protein
VSNLVHRALASETQSMSGSANIVYLYAARAARGFGDGFAAIILPA